MSLEEESYNMVVIAPEIFSINLQPLLEHKNSFDVPSFLKNIEDIYSEYPGRDNAEKIKFFIKDAIERWEISFVLLVGGAELLPSRYTHIFYDEFTLYHTPEEWVFLSDLYYADIYEQDMSFSSWDTNNNNVFAEYDWYGNTDNLDLVPDISLGRLACVNPGEVDICVNKIIAFEKEESYKQEWFTNLVAIGGDSLPGDSEQIDEGEYVQQEVIEIMEGFVPTRIWASNGKLYEASNINDAINQGAGFVFFNGHGNLDLWATHPHEDGSTWIPSGSYRNSDIASLSNAQKLPIVVSDACYHCTYNVKPDCFGWSFLTNPNGGAIAFLGGTDIDLSYGGSEIITKGVEKLCLLLAQHYKNGVSTVGELARKSLVTYLASERDAIDLITVMENQLFGDPSLKIASKSCPPTRPETPQGPPTGKIGIEYVYSSSTTDPDGDQLLYLFDWGDGSLSKWMGPYDSGHRVTISHNWTKKGNYEIRVMAKDEHGVMSEWSDPLTIRMSRNISVYDLFQRFLENHPYICILIRTLGGI
jgi:hypothetical protein